MDKAMSRGLLVGCPFGGIGFVWHNTLMKHIQIFKRDPEGRCMILKLSVASHSLLVCNLYLPVLMVPTVCQKLIIMLVYLLRLSNQCIS